MDRRKMLEELVLQFGRGNKSAFAARIGITPQRLNHWLSRGVFDAELLCRALPMVSARWLLTGEGDMAPPAAPALLEKVEELSAELARLRAALGMA